MFVTNKGKSGKVKKLMTNVAQELAQRWACECEEKALNEDELDSLLDWVRCEMQNLVDYTRIDDPNHKPNHNILVLVLRMSLGISENSMLKLCEAAGWPA